MLFERVSARGDSVLIPETKVLLQREAECVAQVLARLAIIDERRLFAAAGYPSMYEFCLNELRLSERAALNRLNASRIAREHPLLLDALADGRIRLSTIFQLSEHLRVASAADLIEGVAHKSRMQAEEWLAQRFARPALPTRVEAIASDGKRCAADTGTRVRLFDTAELGQLPPGGVALPKMGGSSDRKEPLPQRAQVIPCREERVAYQFTVDRGTHELLLRAQELLGSEVAPGDVASVMTHALRALIHEREKARHGLHSTTRGPAPRTPKGRYVPARLRAFVYRRDGGRCAFVTDDGKRCECRRALQYDHVVPLAQGGQTCESNLRLLCAAHNQYEAERRLGRAFMAAKRRSDRESQTHMSTRASP